MKEQDLHLPSKTSSIKILEQYIEEIKEEYTLGDDLYGNIIISVVESVNNAIIHGNKNDETKHVHISTSLQEASIHFFIVDEGNGFDYNNVPDPTLPENISKESGRGFYLMKKLSDELNVSQNGSSIELVFYLS